MKKCPPGVVCFESMTLVSLLGLAIILLVFLPPMLRSWSGGYDAQRPHPRHRRESYPPHQPEYVALGDGGYGGAGQPPIFPSFGAPRLVSVPTNVNFVNADYRQVGILTPKHGDNKNKILPLFGRPLYSSRSKWQYYSMSNQNHVVKLPIRVKGKSGTTDYGVDELFSGDSVFVEGYNDEFKVTMYENDTIRYL
jgi:hypothetical protein